MQEVMLGRVVERHSPARLGTKRVSAKISHLMRDEDVPQKQAVAMALTMEREGRLGPRGGYRRKRR